MTHNYIYQFIRESVIFLSHRDPNNIGNTQHQLRQSRSIIAATRNKGSRKKSVTLLTIICQNHISPSKGLWFRTIRENTLFIYWHQWSFVVHLQIIKRSERTEHLMTETCDNVSVEPIIAIWSDRLQYCVAFLLSRERNMITLLLCTRPLYQCRNNHRLQSPIQQDHNVPIHTVDFTANCKGQGCAHRTNTNVPHFSRRLGKVNTATSTFSIQRCVSNANLIRGRISHVTVKSRGW